MSGTRQPCVCCGAPLNGRVGRSAVIGVEVCSRACVIERHNTKMKRGAKVHDMLCEGRRTRKGKLLTDVSRVVREWLDEDARAQARTPAADSSAIGDVP